MEEKTCEHCGKDVLGKCFDPDDCILGNRPVDRVVSVPAWISVDERLPTHIYSVLAYVVAGGFAAYGEPMKDIVCYNPKSGEWLQNVGDIGDEVVTVTHWMDLPDDPAH